MSIQKRNAQSIFELFTQLVDQGKTEVRPGDIASTLRALNSPMGVWQVRGILSELAADGLIVVNPETGAWRLADTDALRADAR